jgi:hypothetical protein
LSNRALYSREPLQHFWNNTIEQLKGMRISQIDPGKLATNLIKDFFLTAYFAFTFRAGSRAEYRRVKSGKRVRGASIKTPCCHLPRKEANLNI